MIICKKDRYEHSECPEYASDETLVKRFNHSYADISSINAVRITSIKDLKMLLL